MNVNAALGKYLLNKFSRENLLKEADHGVRYAIEKPKEGSRYHTVAIWVGKGGKPVEYGLTESLEVAEKIVDRVVKNRIASKRAKEDAKATSKAKTVKMRENIRVGSLFSYSWGYEQTNVEFYQVVEKSASGATVYLRRIAGETVKETGPMSSKVRPVPNCFTSDEVIKKRVNQYGVNFDHGGGYLCDADETFHCSWYH